MLTKNMNMYISMIKNLLIGLSLIFLIKYAINILDISSFLLPQTECEPKLSASDLKANSDKDNALSQKDDALIAPRKSEPLSVEAHIVIFIVALFTFFGMGVSCIETYRYFTGYYKK